MSVGSKDPHRWKVRMFHRTRMDVTEEGWLNGLTIPYLLPLEAQSLVTDEVFDNPDVIPYGVVTVTFPQDESQYVTEIPGKGAWLFVRQRGLAR